MTEEYVAVVQKVEAGGKKPHAVARVKRIRGSSVTFSLKPTVWSEDTLPTVGSYVVLSVLRKYQSGWRALKGRNFLPSDEQKAKERTNGAKTRNQRRPAKK